MSGRPPPTGPAALDSPSPSSAPAARDRLPHPSTGRRSEMKEILLDLSARFIVNLPEEELVSLERICFQVEAAHWYYEDFVREERPHLPSYSLKPFSALLFQTCPLLSQWSGEHERAFADFMRYKTRVPVCGAIMINPGLDKCVLVKGWKSSSAWGFPKGKINLDEPQHLCAIREVLEETGFDIADLLLPDEYVDVAIKEQRIRLYLVPNVPEDTVFETQTRKEISKIQWFKFSELPTWRKSRTTAIDGGKFYLITPFVGRIKSFVKQRRALMPALAPAPIDLDEGSATLKALLGLSVSDDASPASSPESETPPVPVRISENEHERSRALLDTLGASLDLGLAPSTSSSTSTSSPSFARESPPHLNATATATPTKPSPIDALFSSISSPAPAPAPAPQQPPSPITALFTPSLASASASASVSAIPTPTLAQATAAASPASVQGQPATSPITALFTPSLTPAVPAPTPPRQAPTDPHLQPPMQPPLPAPPPPPLQNHQHNLPSPFGGYMTRSALPPPTQFSPVPSPAMHSPHQLPPRPHPAQFPPGAFPPPAYLPFFPGPVSPAGLHFLRHPPPPFLPTSPFPPPPPPFARAAPPPHSLSASPASPPADHKASLLSLLHPASPSPAKPPAAAAAGNDLLKLLNTGAAAPQAQAQAQAT